VTVARDTGTVTVRAIFPNPQGLLLPGMYVRAHLIEGTQAQGILAPQQAVSRDERGNPIAFVVGPDNKLEVRQLTTSRAIGDKWLVTSGLKAGDRLVMDGAMMAQPGMPVQPVPWTPAASAAGPGQPGAPAAPAGGSAPGTAPKAAAKGK